MVEELSRPTIALLTDFGVQDSYVGVMKAVIASIAPSARVIDITHSIPQGGIRQAAFKIWQAEPYFPTGTTFVLVVDPGVGTDRRAVAVEWADRRLVAPDNGVLTFLLAQRAPERAIELTEPRYQLRPVSSTFHGRDIFAPAGAHLAAGVPLPDLGAPIKDLNRLRLPTLARPDSDAIKGEIVNIDVFGNLISSIGRLRQEEGGLAFEPWLPSSEHGRLPMPAAAHLPGGTRLPLHGTFGDVAPGQPVAYVGSEGLLEIAINGGSAQQEFQLAIGDPIELRAQGRK